MRPSQVNPNIWNGQERSGGYIARNVKPSSSNSPDIKGRVYVAGVGWYWISGWAKDTQNGEIHVLRLQEMTDEQAIKFCKPKPQRREPSGQSTRDSRNGSESLDTDIPF